MADPQVSWVHWFAMATLSLMIVIAVAQVPKYWRGELQDLHAQGSEGWWPFGEALRRSFLRSLHLGIVGGTFLVIAVVLVMLGDGTLRGTSGRVTETAADVFIALFGLTFVLDLSVTLFNRPRALVPPTYRDEPGAIGYWLARRRKAR